MGCGRSSRPSDKRFVRKVHRWCLSRGREDKWEVQRREEVDWVGRETRVKSVVNEVLWKGLGRTVCIKEDEV